MAGWWTTDTGPSEFKPGFSGDRFALSFAEHIVSSASSPLGEKKKTWCQGPVCYTSVCMLKWSTETVPGENNSSSALQPVLSLYPNNRNQLPSWLTSSTSLETFQCSLAAAQRVCCHPSSRQFPPLSCR